MAILKSFFKGIVVGIGGIAPGLSGSVLLVILGLYEQTIHAVGTFFLDFKKNVKFLLPSLAGFGVGILLFSKAVDYLLENFEFYTRYAFLGLVTGTIPLFYHEVKKKGLHKRHYLVIAAGAALGFFLFSYHKGLFPPVTEPNLWQSAVLGFAVAGSSIVPGVDSAVILSSLGLYELYVGSLADLNMQILIPAAVGLAVGVLLISTLMNLLLKNVYTMTFSVIFGLFLSIIPNVLTEACVLQSAADVCMAVGLAVIGFLISYYLGDIKGGNEKIQRLIVGCKRKCKK